MIGGRAESLHEALLYYCRNEAVHLVVICRAMVDVTQWVNGSKIYVVDRHQIVHQSFILVRGLTFKGEHKV